MGFRCGIVGLPNVGKSTLFNAMTKANVAADNFPFCTVDSNVGSVPVPDHRLHQVAEIVKPNTVIPATMTFVDIAGLIAGASDGEGLGNRFLGHIRETDAIAHVVRCFEDESVVHVDGTVSPRRDIETLNLELARADLETAERALARLGKIAQAGDVEAKKQCAVLGEIVEALSGATAIRSTDLSRAELDLVGDCHFLTAKPVLYIANVTEFASNDDPHIEQVSAHASEEGSPMVTVCSTLENELQELPEDEQMEYLIEFGLEEPGLNRLIRAGYELLGLHQFFSTESNQVRSWTIPRGITAAGAAGIIHTDFERGFIRAEVVAYQDFVDNQGDAGAKAAGKWRLEGRDYIVQDGDVIKFRFNV